MLNFLYQTTTDPVADARRILTEAVERYQPSHILGLLSGGNDSVCASHVAHAILGERFTGVAHIDTQTGLPASRAHLERVVAQQGWRLKVYTPPLPKWGREGETAYEAIIRRWGFPGPAGHTVVYNRLKERCVLRLVREHRQHAKDRIMLVGGMRLAESTRRMGNAKESERLGARVWVAPILRWENFDKAEYMATHALPANPVTKNLGISGECCCGAFACPGEYQRIALHYPEHAKTIQRWEAIARESGQPRVWGERPPETEKVDPAQASMFGLCWSCGTKAERRSA